jgi:hypothetical protein
MDIVNDAGSAPIRIWTQDVEASPLQQLRSIARLPFIHPEYRTQRN